MSKLFTIAGTGARNGVTRIRGGVNADREAAMIKAGLVNIILVTLPHAMTKLEAAKHIVGMPEFAGAAEQEAIQSYIDNQEPTAKPKAKKAEVVVATEEEVDAANALVDAEVAEMKAEMKMTFEEALAQVPMRDKGRFIKREVREQMARDLMAA